MTSLFLLALCLSFQFSALQILFVSTSHTSPVHCLILLDCCCSACSLCLFPGSLLKWDSCGIVLTAIPYLLYVTQSKRQSLSISYQSYTLWCSLTTISHILGSLCQLVLSYSSLLLASVLLVSAEMWPEYLLFPACACCCGHAHFLFFWMSLQNDSSIESFRSTQTCPHITSAVFALMVHMYILVVYLSFPCIKTQVQNSILLNTLSPT